MAIRDHRPRPLDSSSYEIFIGLLSVLSIVNLVLLAVIDDHHLDVVLAMMNLVLSVIFLVDFLYRLFSAESKREYFFRQFGWADLLASLPIPHLKVFRLFRLIRVVELVRTYGARRVLRSIVDDRAESALLTLLLLGILVLEFGSLAILRVEQHQAQANIVSAGDAVWYVLVTISTVGYGDRYPVSVAGRIIGAMIIVVGVGIFGTFTGFLANIFLSDRRARAADTPEQVDAGSDTSSDRLRELLAQQRATMDEIERLLDAGD